MKDFNVVFWDFDGVIKESLAVKGSAFEQLFLPYGREVATRVREHHELHGGMSRFEKMPIYLGWADQPATAQNIQAFCERFRSATLQAVIDAPWVPGVREYLLAHHDRQHFVLVTATPQADIEQILEAVGLARCFREVYGAPTPKAQAVGKVLLDSRYRASQALVVGDSDTDHDAAAANGVAFMLRRTPFNQGLQQRFAGPAFDELET